MGTWHICTTRWPPRSQWTELLTTRTATVDVDPTGATVTDWSGKRNPNARIGMSVDPAVFFDRFVERIGRFARRT